MFVGQVGAQRRHQRQQRGGAALQRLVHLRPGGDDVVAQRHQPVVRAQHPEHQQRGGCDQQQLLRAHGWARRMVQSTLMRDRL